MKNMSKLNEVILNLRVVIYFGNFMEVIWGVDNFLIDRIIKIFFFYLFVEEGVINDIF